jgi:outer membrane protein assembly factor BamD (BamD/ComL family)
MRSIPVFSALVLALGLVACGPPVRDVTTPSPTEPPTPEARRMYDEAVRAFRAKRFDDAADLFEEVWETWPASTIAPKAEYWAAESLYRDGEYHASFLAFKRWHEAYRMNEYLDRLEARLFLLGKRKIAEGSTGVFGTRMFKTSAQGVEILDYLVASFPNGEWLDDALFELGKYHRADGDLPEAARVFEQMVKECPYSPLRFQSRLLLAASYREMNRGAPYDKRVLRKARTHYRAFLEETAEPPDRATQFAAKRDLANRRLTEIDERLGESELLVAKWYLHIEENEAAAFYLTRTATLHPKTDAGRMALDLLRSMGRSLPETPRDPESR